MYKDINLNLYQLEFQVHIISYHVKNFTLALYYFLPLMTWKSFKFNMVFCCGAISTCRVHPKHVQIMPRTNLFESMIFHFRWCTQTCKLRPLDFISKVLICNTKLQAKKLLVFHGCLITEINDRPRILYLGATFIISIYKVSRIRSNIGGRVHHLGNKKGKMVKKN